MYGETLDCRFMAERWIWVVRGMWGSVGSSPTEPWTSKSCFGLAVERLEVVIAERPGGGDAVMVLDLLEVTATESWQAGAVHLGVAADPVVDAWLERLPGLRVIPGPGSDVALLDEHMVGLAVLRLSGQELAALNDEHIQAGVLQRPSQRAAAHAGADDHHVGSQTCHDQV